MKTLCLIFGTIFLVNFSTAQYSYVYEIRHKPEKNAIFGDMTQLKYRPSEESQSEASPSSEPKTREFSVKGPEVGPSLLNLIRSQMQEKDSARVEPKESIWSSSAADGNYGKSSSLSLQSNTDSPTYARQPPKYMTANDLPVYMEKYQIPKEYQIQKEYIESRPLREEPKIYEQRPIHTLSRPSNSMESMPTRSHERPHDRSYDRSSQERSQRPQSQREKEDKMRTVHSIQTPNYRIQLVSKPEPLEQIMPLLEQYKLNGQPFQSQSYLEQLQPLPTPSHLTSGPSMRESSSYRESAKPLMLSVEPDARILEPSRHREEAPRDLSHQSQRPRSRPSYEDSERPQMRTHPIRQYSAELRPEPRPILEMPRQELPPQMQLLKGRQVIPMPPTEPRSHPLVDNRPSYPMRPKIESLPVTALYQMSAPNLMKSRVEYAAEEEAKRDGRRPTASYKEEPTVYRVVERQRPGKEESTLSLIDLSQELEKMDPSLQKAFFDKIKSQSMEMSDRSRTKYRNDDNQKPTIASDPNYKPSPIPDEYKPFTQTRYYKTYV